MPSLKQHLPRLALLAALALGAAGAQAAYIKVSNSGAFLPDSAVLGSGPNEWACTYDDATHLLWEMKTRDGGLRDESKRYTNYDDASQAQVWNGDTPATWRNPLPTEINASTNSIGFQKAVNAQGLCGFTDWRRPTGDRSSANAADKELQSLFSTTTWDYVDPAVFNDSSAWFFWSGSPVAGDPGYAWLVLRSYGFVNWDSDRNYALALRLVRPGQLFSLLIQTAGSGTGR